MMRIRMYRIYCLGLLLFLAAENSHGQTFTGGGGHIMDDGSDNYYSLLVSGLVPTVMDTNFGLESVCIDLTHTYLSDLQISVISPAGTEFLLVAGNGGGDDNYTNTCFNTQAGQALSSGSAPYTGTWTPQGAMASVNNGQNPNGTWQLHILDTYPYADEGDLISWSISIGDQPAEFFPFERSKLPIVRIETGGKTIPQDDKMNIRFSIIDHGNGQYNYVTDSGNNYTGLAGIELRGNSSNMFPKKSYGLETRFPDSSSRDVALLGMPAESDWVLIANYTDKTLMRNYFSYRMFGECGYYSPRMRYCEVVIDGEYQGIYLLGEKIKRGQFRVPVAPMDSTADITYPNVTGGYIFKLDWIKPGDAVWTSNYPAVGNTSNLQYILEYPKPEHVAVQQLNYINSYVDSFEFVMMQPYFADPALGYRKYIDVPSFIDFMLLNEFTKNVDAYRLSTFFYKNRFGKIFAGPPWDFDLAWGNADYFEGWDPAGWCYVVQEVYSNQSPFWWSKLMTDTSFTQQMRCRWELQRNTVFNIPQLYAKIDTLAQMLDESVDVNFTKWPILGTYVWPNPSPIPTDYQGEISKLKTWVHDRIAWLDANLPGPCPTSAMPESILSVNEMPKIFPNPASRNFEISGWSNAKAAQIELFSMEGKLLWTSGWDGHSIIQLPPEISIGVYIIVITDEFRKTPLRLGIIE
jgi:subtilisin-like proprotein convertase family protein